MYQMPGCMCMMNGQVVSKIKAKLNTCTLLGQDLDFFGDLNDCSLKNLFFHEHKKSCAVGQL